MLENKTILITGGSGLLAVNWAVQRREFDQIHIGLHKRQIKLEGVETASIDFDNLIKFAALINDIQPDVIIHTAAMTNVNDCETDPEQAFKVNRDTAELAAKIANDRNIAFVHISTDHLFDGSTAMLDETALPNPLNNYGKSKFEGEQAVINACPDALIFRVNFFGWGPSYRPSFSDWIINSLRSNQTITLYDNVFFTPLYTGEVIDACHGLINQRAKGIYHLTSSNRLSKHKFGIKLADVFGLDKDLITRGEYIAGAGIPRPLDMSLDNSKLLRQLSLKHMPIDASIAELRSGEHIKATLFSIEQ